ncbi:MAG: preprotein translocase subunit SecD [Parcubacteria group bacterium Gr01-1014_8]|nr:MAG: preprotein translocase subunit SecD [Parcubacteria group bacterium Gr01-1014_8]
MWKTRLIALGLLAFGALVGWYVYSSEISGSRPFRLGLDLSGGTQLVYKADLSEINPTNTNDSMASLRDTIERRVNLFGVAEPIVQTEKGGALAGETEERLIVELPGVTDTEAAIAMIGQTPSLEFRLLKKDMQSPPEGTPLEPIKDLFEPASVTGKHVEHAELQFGNGGGGLSNEPVVVLNFNDEGKQLFADLTRTNVGRPFGIFLDNVLISIPVIREAIPDGTAVISGNFTPESARELVRNLNFGALPVPIELLTTETVGGTLGGKAVESGLMAGLGGVIAVIVFMLLWYRLPGLLASLALTLYVLLSLAVFKLIPVTLTAAGIAAFILSIGMAVDANVLIFERMKEEMKKGKNAHDSIKDGFARAWLSIRDSNISSIITAIILFWFGTSLVKGFALVFGLGVIISMLTAISVSRTFLLALGVSTESRLGRWFLSSGFSR